MLSLQLVERLGASDCGRDGVAALEQDPGQVAAEAAGRSGDEPGGHRVPLRWWWWRSWRTGPRADPPSGTNSEPVEKAASAAPRDKEATKRRILDAAIAEFSAFGLSGARVDRIAGAAHANKRMIYVYFGNKEELFDVVVAEALQRLISAVPLVPDDLPGYAGAMLDALSDASAFRLSTWRQLERPEATQAEAGSCADKLTALRAVSADRAPDRLSPATCLAIILAVAQTRHLSSPALQADLSARDQLREEIEAVRRMTATAGRPSPTA